MLLSAQKSKQLYLTWQVIKLIGQMVFLPCSFKNSGMFLKNDIMDMFSELYAGRLDLDRMNYADVSVNPKRSKFGW